MTRFLCVAALVAAFTTVGCNDKQATNSSAKAQDTATTKANAEAPAEGTGDTKETPKASVQAAKVGEAAPDFELKDLDGKSVKLSDYKGKVVVLPHMGSATLEGRIDMGEKVIINIRAFVDGHRPPDRVLPSRV